MKIPLLDDLGWFLDRSRARRLRSMRQFAEQEIIIPGGPFFGRRFRCHRQPYTGLWFDAVDSGRFSRCVATGPTQSGKTLSCFVIPLLYHLLEVGETVICGLPDMDMAGDKWREDILPVIEQSRYRDLLPRQGGGSRGGRVESLQLRNGATLKFMSGGGSDKSRAGFTSRVVVITETDGMDEAGATSRESDKITQLEARTRAYGNRKRIYMECTVSTEQGRTWQEYQQGTRSQILVRCPHCQFWVAPEREHLVGWHGANSQAEARQKAKFHCPECSGVWSDQNRIQANSNARLVHQGQLLTDDGTVEGDAPTTDTLGFRWSAVHNLFLTAGEIAADEWRASRAANEENAEREMRQFVWCIPVESAKTNMLSLEAMQIASRLGAWTRGTLPADTKWLTAAVDVGKYLLHWVIIAWREGATGHIVDYGRTEVPSPDLGVEQGVLVALRQFRELALEGWPLEGSPKSRKKPDSTWCDAGYMTDVVYSFCRESGNLFRPSVGRGATQQRQQSYNKPTQAGSVTQFIGQGFHFNLLPTERLHLAEVDADHWKTWVHQRLETPVGSPGALTIYQALPQEHLSLAKHLTAETKTEEFIAGRGVVTRWERLRRENHWLDALYNASAAGHFCGARLLDETPAAPQRRRSIVVSGGARRSDGREWLDVAHR